MISIKSNKEIDIMRKAGEILARLHKKLEELAVPGITTIELDKIAEEFIKSNGSIPSFKGYKGLAGAIDFPGCICASTNEEVVHGIPSNRKLIDGDIISIDIGVCYNGYHADAARTLAIGNISPEATKLIEVTRNSCFEGIKKAIEGNRIIDISAAIEDCVRNDGFSIVRDYVGHGIGKQVHEEPQIPNYRTRQRGSRLEVGMALAIEPMINLGTYKVEVLSNKWTVVTVDRKISAHYENTIAITKSGPLIITEL